MEVSAVLVDDINLADDLITATVASTLYEFAEPQWVSTHHERKGPSIGPLTLVQSDPTPQDFGIPAVKRRYFGARSLTVTPGSTPTISYKETWTRPANCLYALVLPPHCAAVQLNVECPGYRYAPPVDVGVTPDHRLFHYVVLMGESGALHVSARVSRDAKQHERALEDSHLVAATDNYAGYRQRLREGAMSTDFWFKLLTLGGKLFGGP